MYVFNLVIVTLCSSAQMKSLACVRSYNVYRVIADSGFWFMAAMVAAVVRQALSCPVQGLLCWQEHWIIFIALMSVWCEGEPTIRGVEITLLNDSLCHQSSSWLRQRHQRWRMWQQLSLEQRCAAILGLDFPQVMTSSVFGSCCSRNLFPSPRLACHHLQAVFVSSSQAGFLQACGITAVTFKESRRSRSMRSLMWSFLMQMKSCSWLEERRLRLWWVEKCNYDTIHSDPWAKVRGSNYMWIWNLLKKEVQISGTPLSDKVRFRYC